MFLQHAFVILLWGILMSPPLFVVHIIISILLSIVKLCFNINVNLPVGPKNRTGQQKMEKVSQLGGWV